MVRSWKLSLLLPISLTIISTFSGFSAGLAKDKLTSRPQIEEEVVSKSKGLTTVVEELANDLRKIHISPATINTVQREARNIKVFQNPGANDYRLAKVFNKVFINRTCWGVVACAIYHERVSGSGRANINNGIQLRANLLSLIQSRTLNKTDLGNAYAVYQDIDRALTVRL